MKKEISKNCAIAFTLEKNTEIFYIGDYDKVKNMIVTGNIDSEVDYFKRKIGSIINDYEKIFFNEPQMDQAKKAWELLSGNIKLGQSLSNVIPTINDIEGLYMTSDNVIWKYILMVIYNYYFIIHSEGAKKIHLIKSKMYKELDGFYNDFCNMVNSVLQPFSNVPQIYENEEGFYKHLTKITQQNTFCVSVEVVSKHIDGNLETYYIAKDVISPIIFVYWDILSKSNLYVRRCKYCNRIVVTNRNQGNVICNRVSCKKQQFNNNTKNSRAKKANIPYEKQYNNARQYWNNSKRKLLSNNCPVDEFENEFTKFKKNGKKLKSLLTLQSSIKEVAEYNNWLFTQQKQCDDIIDKILLQYYREK